MRHNSHVAEIRGDLHSGAAVHVLPHVPPQLQRRRVQAEPGVRVEMRRNAADIAVPVGDKDASE
jgi:hypothetical protein